ncbi:MAG: site-specific DNA-methyltransferase [Gammaproteobacteria bacterium]|nr:site-specific DNA-methyltransferase [Gammaproteobacteria bacterium]
MSQDKTELRMFDPFVGSGTSVLAACASGIEAVGIESHPFIYRVARAKTNWNVDLSRFRDKTITILAQAKNGIINSSRAEIPLLGKCFTDEALNKLDSLRHVFLESHNDATDEGELAWLAITSIIRSCSTAGTAQWQYVLPNKKKAKVTDPFDAFELRVAQMHEDILHAQNAGWTNNCKIVLTDARDPVLPEAKKYNLVITSPPYPNNYDYADATRLEMTFWGEVKGWGDIHDAVRKHLIRSCSQHSSKEKLDLDDLLQDAVLDPIIGELEPACRELAEVRKAKGGMKAYHTMAAAYFTDLGDVFQALRPICSSGSKMCFVVGDSAPYAVYLSVDRWLGELALAAGFKSYKFEKLRDRNTKWKNRKHNVPLHEGRLWIEG